MNLEVDVMEGDEFTTAINGGTVYQIRSDTYRLVMFRWVGQWINVRWLLDTPRIDFPTVKRYCEGCGLTVKHIKPEPQVETIKPPEWGVITKDGVIVECESEKARDALIAKFPMEGYKPIRIDWGNK